MERRALIATVLAIAVYVGWLMIFGPPPAPPPAAPVSATDVAAGGAGAGGPSAQPGDEDLQTDLPGETRPADSSDYEEAVVEETTPSAVAGRPVPPALQAAAEETVTVETDMFTVVVSNRGGRILSWKLRKYLDAGGKPHDLVSPAVAATDQPIYPFALHTEKEKVNSELADALFVLTRYPGGNGSDVIGMSWSDGQGLEAEKKLVFREGSYFAEVSATVQRGARRLPSEILWGPGIGDVLEMDKRSSMDHTGQAVSGTTESVTRVTAKKVEERQEIPQPAAWAGMDDRYFAAFFLPTSGSRLLATGHIYPLEILPAPGAKLEKHVAIGVDATDPLQLYAGPKDYELLSAVGFGTARLVDFARPFPLPFIGPILNPLIELLAKLLYFCLRWLHDQIPNWGIAIILLTTAIKVVFYPITQRSFVKMRRVQKQMASVQPKVKAIKEKYRKLKGAEARQKMNQETMDLYKKEGINPLGGMSGCLPLLIQLPFLYAMYNVLIVSIELRRAPFFGWITDLSQKDPYYITPILMGVTMFVQQRMSMQRITDPEQRAQQRMMLLMPVMFTAFFVGLPAGLTLYWFVSNLLQIGQQVLINRQADRETVEVVVEEETGKGPKGGRRSRQKADQEA